MLFSFENSQINDSLPAKMKVILNSKRELNWWLFRVILEVDNILMIISTDILQLIVPRLHTFHPLDSTKFIMRCCLGFRSKVFLLFLLSFAVICIWVCCDLVVIFIYVGASVTYSEVWSVCPYRYSLLWVDRVWVDVSLTWNLTYILLFLETLLWITYFVIYLSAQKFDYFIIIVTQGNSQRLACIVRLELLIGLSLLLTWPYTIHLIIYLFFRISHIVRGCCLRSCWSVRIHLQSLVRCMVCLHVC